jgi:hypothetical protein
VFPLLLYIFSKKYNWTNWNEKLFGSIEEPIIEVIVDEENNFLE